jgi:lipoprotein-anchoring transpeptidase ErfK/SrfK
MTLRTIMSPLALSAVALTLAAAATQPARAQSPDGLGQVFFLWGGDKEWGGGRQTVGFNQSFKPGQVVVSFGDRRLYLVTGQGQAISYPIAIPREQSRWEGITNVSQKRENPAWTPTPEMRRENPRLPSWVPGGHPMNPLGVRALYLGTSTYRIHGTDAPWTIGQAVSKGCIRMKNEDVLDLYPRVPVGARVTVTWQRFATKEIASGGASDVEDRAARAAEARTTYERRQIRQYSRAPSRTQAVE